MNTSGAPENHDEANRPEDLNIDLDTDGEFRLCRCGCRKPVMPKSNFLQGHDAKLKSALIECALRGGEVHHYEDGLVQSTAPLEYAVSRGYSFGGMVVASYTRQLARVQERIERATEKATAKATKAAATRRSQVVETDNVAEALAAAPAVVKVKVGRWAYTGTVTDGTFVYTDGKGKVRKATKFELV